MKYEALKAEIQSIAEIAASVPEAFRQRCFEVLLDRLLTDSGSTLPQSGGSERVSPRLDAKIEKDAIPTPAQVRVFMQKTGVTTDQLAAVVTVADGEVHFLREPTPSKVAHGQTQWALLLALKNGLSSNSFTVDPEAVRSICQEKGFYDKGNFASIFKKDATAKLFKKPLEPQGEAQGLSSEGFDKLGDLIKSLASAQ